jgi:thymidylate synthase ThyX
MIVGNQELFKYIERRAKYNVKDKKFFRNTDILKEAFLVSEDIAYEILKDIMSRKNIKNTKDAVIEEYMNMLGDGYASLKEQMELFGGHKLSTIKKEAELRFRKFKGGTIIDVLKDVYNVAEEDIPSTLMRYMDSLTAQEFAFKVNINTFYKFLDDNMDELDKQAERYAL